MGTPITSYTDLRAYQHAFDAAMRLFDLSRSFPPEERYSLTDQVRRSSRSVCTNIGEAWRKRRYRGAFVAKLSDAETEACETQVWLDFAERCGYIEKQLASDLRQRYDAIMGQLVRMIEAPEKWERMTVCSPLRSPLSPPAEKKRL